MKEVNEAISNEAGDGIRESSQQPLAVKKRKIPQEEKISMSTGTRVKAKIIKYEQKYVLKFVDSSLNIKTRCQRTCFGRSTELVNISQILNSLPSYYFNPNWHPGMDWRGMQRQQNGRTSVIMLKCLALIFLFRRKSNH